MSRYPNDVIMTSSSPGPRRRSSESRGCKGSTYGDGGRRSSAPPAPGIAGHGKSITVKNGMFASKVGLFGDT
jgi:hypothetical protein